MIKWKQRLYALFLRRALGPILDAPSQQVLHESIDVSFQEGTFALSNIGLSTSYLNEKVAKGGVQIKKARVESITIQLSLIEGQSSTAAGPNDSSSSLAWRAMSWGTTVALLAHVEVNGIELEVQPLPKERRESCLAHTDDTNIDQDEDDDNHNDTDLLAQTKSVLSSYLEAALGSLRLTVNLTNLSIRLYHQSSSRGTKSFVELRLPSLKYQDLDVTSSDNNNNNNDTAAEEHPQRSSYKTIFEKKLLFQGITMVAGESQSSNDSGTSSMESIDSSDLISTIAMVEGTGQVSVRAVEYTSNNDVQTQQQQQQDDKKKRVQQDIDVRINQQVKVSVSETSLLQIQAVVRGFGEDHPPTSATTSMENDMSASELTQRELGSVFSESTHSDSRQDEKEVYTIDGIMKQYQEARQLAERNEMRGGILVPSNAFEEGDHVGEGDPRTFDVFFDANDKSFYNYASVMKDSVMGLQEGPLSDFVHTKLRLHLSGGGIKVSFRGRKTDTKTFLGPEEYILLTFNDLEITSRLSRKRVELSFQISHLEIDDAQIPHTDLVASEGRRVEIGNLLCFAEPPDDDVGGSGDLLLQPACISVQLSVDTEKEEQEKRLNLELNLKPVELIYRARTFTHIRELVSKLGSESKENNSATITPEAHPKAGSKTIFNSAMCTISSLTVTVPVPATKETDDFSPLFDRCGQYVNSSLSTEPALGFVLDNLSLEHKQGVDNTQDDEFILPSETTTLDVHSFLVFVSSPEYRSGPIRRSRVIDLFGATGRFEVNPFIPITVAYKRNLKGQPCETNVASETFPSVPAFSSFKARQEDEDEDEQIDRVLSEKLSNVSFDSRRALRAKDPQTKMLQETEDCEAVIMVHVPDIVLDLSKEELLVALVMVNAVLPETEKSGTETAAAVAEEDAPKPQMAISVAVDSISLCVLDKESDRGQINWNSHLIRLDKCRAYTIINGKSSRFCRLLAHEATFFELGGFLMQDIASSPGMSHGVQARALSLKNRTLQKRCASAVPIFYRSKLFPAISHTSPSILLDITQPLGKGSSDQSETSIFFSLYHMTYRYDPDSKWIERLNSFFVDLQQDECTQAPDTEAPSLTRVFLSIADCNLDYTSLRHFKTPSRSILRVGDLRFSSNIVKPAAPVQAYTLSMGDFSWFLCNTRASHNFENSHLPGAGDLMTANDLEFKANRSRGGYPTSTTETVFRDMCFKTVLTLESIDAIIVKANEPESKLLASKEAGLTLSQTLGELALYLCKDTFQCFAETIGELQTKMTALSDEEIKDLRAQLTQEQLDVLSRKADTNETTDQHKRQDNETRTDVTAIPVGEDFLLDGYDWTTIDMAGPRSEIPPGEEQSARWFHQPPVIDDGRESGLFNSFPGPLQDATSNSSAHPRILSQHFPLQVASDPLGDGDMEASKYAGTDSVAVNTRILLHDLKVKVRFFDGYDWPEYQSKKKRDPKALFVIAEPSAAEEQDTCESDQQQKGNNDKKAALLGGLLAGGDETSTTFGDLPLPEERVRLTLAQNEVRRLSRRTSSYIQFSARGVSLRVDSYRDSTEHRLKSCLGLSLKDFFLAETISSLNPVKMFGEWFNEVEHPRDSRDGLLMLKMVTWDPVVPLTPELQLASEECEVALTLAPMRCILDQRTIQFAQAFFDDKGDKSAASTSPDWTTGLHLVPAPFVRCFRVRPWKIKVDYTPHQIDTEALKDGSIIELLNLSPLDALVLTLPQVEMDNAEDFGEAIGTLIGRWLADVKTTQLYKFLTNARPFEPITTIGGGVADLFVIPWDAYKHGGSVSRALRSSVSSLMGNVAHETLTTSSRMAGFIAAEMAKAAVGSHPPPGASNISLPSRPLTTPRRVSDTAGHALESLARGVQTANYKVVIVPYREYRRSGTTGAVKSIARGIPVAIAGPVGGASEALSYTLLGVRNQIRPDIRKEEEVSQRGLHYGGI